MISFSLMCQGGIKYKFCALAQYGSLVGITIGCTITASVSMA